MNEETRQAWNRLEMARAEAADADREPTVKISEVREWVEGWQPPSYNPRPIAVLQLRAQILDWLDRKEREALSPPDSGKGGE